MFDDFDIDDYNLELEVPSTDEVFNTEIGNSIEWSVEDNPLISPSLGGLEEQPNQSPFDNTNSVTFDCETSSDRCNELNTYETDIDDLASIRDDLDMELNGLTNGQNISFGTAFCWNFCRAGTDAGNARYHVQHGC